MRDWVPVFHRRFRSPSHALHGLLVEFYITDAALKLQSLQNALRLKIRHGSFVLVNRAHQHPFARGTHRFRQGIPPPIESFIADFTPIHRHKHHRLLSADQHDALGEERIGHGLGFP